MDPNEALAILRKRIAWLREAIDNNDTDTAIAEAELIATEFEGLDRWINRGGFLPTDWVK